MSYTLSGLVVTHNSEERIGALLDSMAQFCDELVAVVGKDSTDRTADICRKKCDIVVERDIGGFPENILEEVANLCNCDWLIRFDDDELPSRNFLNLTSINFPEEATHIRFPRYQLVDREHYICTYPWGFDYQSRMFRRGMLKCDKLLHAPAAAKGMCMIVPYHIFHYNFLVKSRQDREKQWEGWREHPVFYYDYEFFRPWYLYEDYFYQVEEVAERPLKIREFPKRLCLELTTRCPADCTHCVNTYIRDKLNRLDMPKDLVFRILDECRHSDLELVSPCFQGEALAYPHFKDFLNYMDKVLPDVGLEIYTNAALLDSEMAKELLCHNLKIIAFSVDGYTKETYERRRLGLQFERVIDNIDNFLSLCPINVHKRFIMTVAEDNYHEAQLFHDRWLYKGNEVSVVSDDGRSSRIGGRHHFGNTGPRWACQHMSDQMYVLCNGDCVICCRDLFGESPTGNIAEGSLYDIWHGKKYNNYRRLVRQKRFDEIEVCKRCGED